MAAAPEGFEPLALGEAVAREGFVAVIGVLGLEAVDVVALGLVAAARQGAQVIGPVEVVLHVAVGVEGELSRMGRPDCGDPFVREADDAEPLAVGVGVLAQQGNQVRKISPAHRLHVADAFAPVDLEADQQEALLLGPGAAVFELPAEHVGECQVAVVDAARQGIGFDGLLVGQTYRVESDHARVTPPRCNFSVRCARNSAG